MADSIQRVIIPLSSLPAVGQDGDYLIRYRIISDDRNRASHWSNIYSVPVYNQVAQVQGSWMPNVGVNTIAWEPVEGVSAYDVFASYDAGTTYVYLGTTNLPSYSFYASTAPQAISVQIASTIKQRSLQLTIFSA